MDVKVINKSNNPLPQYETELSAGMDLRAFINEDIELKPGQRTLVPTGLFLELPQGYEAQIRPRSGLAFKHGISLVNTPGTIDADYRGEIGILLINHGQETFVIKSGERVCQMVINKFERISLNAVTSLNETERGAGGFGHTGK